MKNRKKKAAIPQPVPGQEAKSTKKGQLSGSGKSREEIERFVTDFYAEHGGAMTTLAYE